MLTKEAYLLRTNCTDTNPAKLWRWWRWYIHLTLAGATLPHGPKSDIGLRPICHQKTERLEVHLLICFLSLSLWRWLKAWMNFRGLCNRVGKLVEAICRNSGSMKVNVPVKRGERTI